MKETIVTITAFQKGLVPKENIRNSLFLTESLGAFPYQGVLITSENFSANQIDASALACTFPFPQIFVLSEVILICTPTAIYEYPDLTTPKISGLTTGTLWSVADYKRFILLTNSQVVVKKDSGTGLYSIDTTRPAGTCIADFNGQMFLTSPNRAVVGDI